MKAKIENKQEFQTTNYFEVESMPLADVVDVSKFIGGSDMFLMSYNKRTVITGDKQEEHKFKKQMIVNSETLKKIFAEPARFDEFGKENKNSNPIVLVDKDFWEFFKEEGVHAQLGKSLGKQDKRDYISFTSKHIFDDAKDSDYMFIQFLENKNHQRVIMDAQGNLACEPMIFDYIAARLDNQMYDLDSLVEYLTKRDDVALIAYSESSYKR